MLGFKKKRHPDDLQAGYIQLIDELLIGSGAKHKVRYRQRLMFNRPGYSYIDIYSPEQTIEYFSNPNKHKVGLFNAKGELVMVLWHLYAIRNTFKFLTWSNKHQMWTTRSDDAYLDNEEVNRDAYAIMKAAGLE